MPSLLYQGLLIKPDEDTPNSLFDEDDDDPTLDVLVRYSDPLKRMAGGRGLTRKQMDQKGGC